MTKVYKSSQWLTQKQKVFASLYKRPQTRLQVSVDTGVPLQNVCRYIRDFKQSESLTITGRDVCSISGMKAEYVSTNPEFKKGFQIKMFE